MINGQADAVVISIHQNSLPGHPRVHGAKVYYNTVLPSREYAQQIQSAVNLAVNGGEERPVTPIDSTIYLMKESRHPAVLVECGFMSNPDECRLLQRSDYQLRVAVAIAAGLDRSFTSERGADYES